MKLSVFPTTLLATVACALAIGCGGVDPADSNEGAGGEAGSSSAKPEGPLLPWAVGNQWTYLVTKDGVSTEKTTTIGKLEVVGGEGPHADDMAYHVTTAKGAKDHTESWQLPDPANPDRIVRYREQSYDASTGELDVEEHWDPSKLHIDGSAERTVTDASWLESYDETKLRVGLSPTTNTENERWTVLDDNETVEVPAGKFEHAIHFQKVGGSALKDYWYVRGVGKVKETGTQTEELTAHQVEETP